MPARNTEAAVYRQIAAQIRARIADGTLRPGDKVGSMAALKHEFDMGQATIVRALALLRVEGLIVGRPGEVPRVADTDLQVDVAWPAGTRIIGRPASPADVERAVPGQDVQVGMPVLVVERDGEMVIYRQDRTAITFY